MAIANGFKTCCMISSIHFLIPTIFKCTPWLFILLGRMRATMATMSVLHTSAL